jgi:hypothetical protein
MSQAVKKRDIPKFDIRAEFVPASLDVEARTVEIVWTTGAKGLRRTWDGDYYEELEVSDVAVRLDRLNNGAPVLAAHDAYSLDSVNGVVERAWIDGNLGKAMIRFATDEKSDVVFQKVAGGILRKISVGYRVYRYEIIESVDEKIPTYRAVDWEPLELSIVPIPFDDGASVRSVRADDAERFAVEILDRSVPDVEEPINNPAVPVVTTEETRMTPEEIRAAEKAAADKARNDEKLRQTEIRSIATKAGLDDAFVQRHIEADAAIDTVRAAAIDAVAERQAASQAATKPAGTRVEMVGSEVETIRDGVENAMLHRFDPQNNKLDDNGRQYRGLSLIEVGRKLAERAGADTSGMTPMELSGIVMGNTRAGGMHSTSDFPLILANAGNKILRMAYETAPKTFVPFARRGSLNDFKAATRLQVGEFPALTKVNEHGEFKRGSVSEAGETIQLLTYGSVVAFTRQSMINDDLNAFMRVMQSAGIAAANLESDTVWAIITANAALADTGALFNATAVTTAGGHANLTSSGTAIDDASLTIGRTAMRKQQSLSGYYLNLTPAFLIVPPEKEGLANKYTSAQFVAAKASDINPNYNTSLQVIVEPRLSANSTTAWYLAANPSAIDTIEYAYLNGQEGVYTESRTGFDVDGMEVKARLDFAAKAIDFRGLYKNVGA